MIISMYFLMFFLSMRIVATFVGNELGKLTGFMSNAVNVLDWVCIGLAVVAGIMLILVIWREITTDEKTYGAVKFGILFVFAFSSWLVVNYLAAITTFMQPWNLYYLLIMIVSAAMFVAVLLIETLKSIFKGRKRKDAKKEEKNI